MEGQGICYGFYYYLRTDMYSRQAKLIITFLFIQKILSEVVKLNFWTMYHQLWEQNKIKPMVNVYSAPR